MRTDPSGHCPNDFCDFFGGFFAQIGYNSNPIPSGYVGSADALAVQPNEPTSMLAGRIAGSVASGVIGYVEAAAGVAIGTGGGIGGALACAPTGGGGCVVAVGAVELGAGLATEGVLTAGKGAVSGAETASILMAKGSGGGTGSDRSRREIEKSIKSFQKRIAEHQQKIEKLIGFDPVGDNAVYNANAAESRMEHLQQEIENWQNQIDQLNQQLDNLGQ